MVNTHILNSTSISKKCTLYAKKPLQNKQTTPQNMQLLTNQAKKKRKHFLMQRDYKRLRVRDYKNAYVPVYIVVRRMFANDRSN